MGRGKNIRKKKSSKKCVGKPGREGVTRAGLEPFLEEQYRDILRTNESLILPRSNTFSSTVNFGQRLKADSHLGFITRLIFISFLPQSIALNIQDSFARFPSPFASLRIEYFSQTY